MSAKLDALLRSYIAQGHRITRRGTVLDKDNNVVAVLPEGTIIEEWAINGQFKAKGKEAEVQEEDRKKAASGDDTSR